MRALVILLLVGCAPIPPAVDYSKQSLRISPAYSVEKRSVEKPIYGVRI